MKSNDFRNSYGYKMAMKRKKKREESSDKELRKARENTQKSEPKMDLYPMESFVDDGFGHIVWGTNDNISDNLVEKVTSEKLTILKLPTGLGKTALAVETVGKMQKDRDDRLPFIVVAPRQVIDKKGWHKTIKSWNDSHPDNMLDPIMIEAPDKFANILDHAKTLRQVLKMMMPDGVVVIDEVHNYKSPTSKRSKKLGRLSKFNKLGLSATPLTNDAVMDTISYLVMSQRYNSKTDFEKRSGLILRKTDRGEYLVYNEDNEIDARVWPYYTTMLEEFSHVIYSPEMNLDEIDLPDVTQKLIQLGQDTTLTNNMKSLSVAYKAGAFDSIIDYLMAMIETIAASEKRLNKLVEIVKDEASYQPLVFYWHNATLDVIRERFDKEGITYQIISGAHSASDVDLSKNEPILIQYQSGSEGIEMPDSNVSIFYQNQNSFSRWVQAKGRNVRRGSTHKVTQYTLLADHPFDNLVFERLVQRQETSTQVLAELAKICNE